MDYLKSFIIGTSGPVWFLHMAALALRNINFYDYSFKAYSLLAPIYYGLMSMFALYIGKTFNLTLRKRLFITSIISICIITCFNYFYSRKKYKPYKNYSAKEWLIYILTNGARHIIAFNLIIYYFTLYFSENYWLRIFVIGSSLFSYIITFISIILLNMKNKVNYDYRLLAVFEPLLMGIGLILNLFIFQNLLSLTLKLTILLSIFVRPLVWLFLAVILKTYSNKNSYEWFMQFIKVFIFNIIIMLYYYFLIFYLK